MKYKKLYVLDQFLGYEPENSPNTTIPKDEMNMDYVRMMEEVEAGTSTIEEVDDTL
jgi:hypothetical protein